MRSLLQRQNALVNEGDINASLDAQGVLELSPENADAMRVIARAAENEVCAGRLSFGDEYGVEQ